MNKTQSSSGETAFGLLMSAVFYWLSAFFE
jgi:hypothetical protein